MKQNIINFNPLKTDKKNSNTSVQNSLKNKSQMAAQ